MNAAALATLAYTLLCAAGLATLVIIGTFKTQAVTYKIPMFGALALALLDATVNVTLWMP